MNINKTKLNEEMQMITSWRPWAGMGRLFDHILAALDFYISFGKWECGVVKYWSGALVHFN